MCLLILFLTMSVVAVAQQATYRTHDSVKLNDLTATPGDIRSGDASELCSKSFRTSSIRHVTKEMKLKVCKMYGISRVNCNGRKYEIDHLISLELGGSNDISNLWPQPYFPKPGAKEKDTVENYLHDQICSNAISVKEAQQRIADDWYAVYLEKRSK